MEDKTLLFTNLINQFVRIELVQGYCYGYIKDIIGNSWIKIHTIVLASDMPEDLHKVKNEEYIPISQIIAVSTNNPKLNQIRISANYKNLITESPFEKEIIDKKKTTELDVFLENLDIFMTGLDSRLTNYKSANAPESEN